VSVQRPSPSGHGRLGERAAALAGSYCTRRVGRAYGQAAWQMLADAARLHVILHGRPEAWAAGAIVAVARASGLLAAGHPLTAQQVAEDLDVTIGTPAVIERELARALTLSRYAQPPAAWRLAAGGRQTPATRSIERDPSDS
jgi:hypothetical protein